MHFLCLVVSRRIARIIASIALALIATPGAARQVDAIRVGVAEDHTRLVLESKTPIRFDLWSLDEPARVLLDLEDVALTAVLASVTRKVDAGHPYLDPVRIERLGEAKVSLVLGLKVAVEPRVFVLKPMGGHGYRLVLDLYPLQLTEPAPVEPPQQVLRETVVRGAPLPRRSRALTEIARPAAEPLQAIPEMPAAPVTAVAPAIGARPPAAGPAGVQERFLEVRINQQKPVGTALFLQDEDGALLARADDLQRWRLRLPDMPPLLYGDEAYYSLDSLQGLSYQINASLQTLALEADPALFGATTLRGVTTAFASPTPAPPGGFLNYDIFASHARGESRASGLVELAGFGRWGTGISRFLARDLGNANDVIRLETTVIHDRPETLTSLRLGDAISGGGSWGRSVRFGGLQWATNFATQPGLITFPLPGVSGEAVLPSTVELYVNDALRLRREVPSGPFSIDDLPVVTGQGDARLVVRDLLGREQIIHQPYYASQRLLQQGLHDYSYELGVVRENFGIASHDYGRPLAIGTHRMGFTDRFTGEVRGELLGDQQTVGLGGAALWPAVGVFSASTAASHANQGTGALLGLGFERQTRRISVGGSIEMASRRFRQVGLQPGQPAPKQSSRAFASLGTGRYGSFGLSYTHQVFRDREEVELLSASYGVMIGQLGFLNLSLLHFLSGDNETEFGLTFTRPLDRRTSASANVTAQPGGQQGLLRVERNLPVGRGAGYRLVAGVADSDRREAAASLQTDSGTYLLEAGRANGETAFRASGSGGVALLGGRPYLSRRITDSFAVVQIPDYSDVRIYADNQPVAVTGRDGSALLPRLRPYQQNVVRIEQADLPLDAQIDTVELNAVPYFRSGLLLQFPIQRSRGALIMVVLENGEPIPAGAVAQVVGHDELFPAGINGEIYLTGLAASNQVRVMWRDQTCDLAVSFPDTTDPQPHLGTYACADMTP